MTAHQHRWLVVMHADGCHFYSYASACECGATRRDYFERGGADDLFAAAWFDTEGCDRCAALAGGAEPKTETEITEADDARRSNRRS